MAARRSDNPFAKLSKEVVEYIRGDLPSSKRDRLVRMDLHDGVPTQAAWDEFNDRLLGAIWTAFTNRREAYLAEIRKQELAQKTPGWNFCTYFIAEEGLCFTYEQVGLIGEAIDRYAVLDLKVANARTHFPYVLAVGCCSFACCLLRFFLLVGIA